MLFICGGAFDGLERIIESRVASNDMCFRAPPTRGLPSILEGTMLDVMYNLPSLTGVKKCIVNKEAIEKKEPPTLNYNER